MIHCECQDHVRWDAFAMSLFRLDPPFHAFSRSADTFRFLVTERLIPPDGSTGPNQHL